jgi:hypothetical protein
MEMRVVQTSTGSKALGVASRRTERYRVCSESSRFSAHYYGWSSERHTFVNVRSVARPQNLCAVSGPKLQTKRLATPGTYLTICHVEKCST